MAKTRQEARTCVYPGCENERRLGDAGAAAEPKYCGLPDPVSGEPHTALRAFRRRQELAQQGGGVAEPEDLRRSWIALWGLRRQRRQQAEADAEEARSAALEADAQLTEALAARAAAEEAAVAARDAAQVRVAEAQRTAEERMAATQQERDQAVAAARSRADDAESRAGAAELGAARVQQAAQSARAERDRADRQMAHLREDARRQQAELRATFEAQLAAVEDARGKLQARAERAEAELQRTRADREQAPGQAAPGPPRGTAGGRGRTSRTRQDPGTEPGRRGRKDGESN
jgi:colicin import membrane protein